jgi:hypothetical protein
MLAAIPLIDTVIGHEQVVDTGYECVLEPLGKPDLFYRDVPRRGHSDGRSMQSRWTPCSQNRGTGPWQSSSSTPLRPRLKFSFCARGVPFLKVPSCRLRPSEIRSSRSARRFFRTSHPARRSSNPDCCSPRARRRSLRLAGAARGTKPSSCGTSRTSSGKSVYLTDIVPEIRRLAGRGDIPSG